MEAELSLASTPAPVGLPDSSMTIDYDVDPVNSDLTASGRGEDEEMGDDVSNLPPTTASGEGGGAGGAGGEEVEEAEMADDEASAWEKDAMVEEGESAEVVPTTVQQEEEVTIDDAETLPEVPTSTSLADVTAALTVPVEIEPVPSTDLSAPLLPPPAQPEPASLSAANECTSVVPNGDSLQPEPPIPVSSEVVLSEGEQADAEQSDFPESLKPTDPSALSTKPTDQSLDSTSSSTPFLRPQVDKASLLGIEISFPDESSPSNPLAPAVLFTYDDNTYSLFRSYKPSLRSAESGEDTSRNGTEDGEGQEEEEEEVQTIFADSPDQQLYFGSLEQLFSKLHDHFPALQSREDELVLDFDEIGVALTEDNVYSRQVSLHDFDRIHLGCGLPGRLHARLYAQSRFSSGFNALAQHVANSLSGNTNGTEEGNESEATYDAGEGTINGDEEEGGEFVEESFVTVGEPEDHEADGPDSELPILEQQSEQEQDDDLAESNDVTEEGVEAGGEDDEEFDLESALAQLDGDDIAAYVEGAQEDYILSQGGEKQDGGDENNDENEGEIEGENVAGEAPAGEGQVEDETRTEVIEESLPTQQDVDQIVETEEAAATEQVEESLPDQSLESAVPEQDQSVAQQDTASSAIDTEGKNGVDAAQTAEDNVQGSVSETAAVIGEETSLPVAPEESSEATATEMNGETNAAELGEGESESANAVTGTAEESNLAEGIVDPNDVVIDYDEAFDGSSSAAPPPSDVVDAGPPVESAQEATEDKAPTAAPHSPKRRHDSLDADEASELAQAEIDGNDAKRQRLEETTPVAEA